MYTCIVSMERDPLSRRKVAKVRPKMLKMKVLMVKMRPEMAKTRLVMAKMRPKMAKISLQMAEIGSRRPRGGPR